ncbi:MAG: T9SS type A sorting domain-containing protein [Flavobacteriia bacterium]
MRFILFITLLSYGCFSFSQSTFQLALGGAQEDFAYSFQQTEDNGFIVAGRTFSFGTGGWECYMSRFNNNGDTLWTKTFGNVLYDELQDVDTTSDGGFIAVGHTTTTDWSGNVYLIRTNANGTLLWSKEYGGATGLSDKGYSVRETSDGGFIISGTTASFGAGGDDVYVLKTNSTGTVLWTTTIGSAGVNEAGREVQQTSDGGYIVAGYSDGLGTSFYDVYLVKLNATGTVQWKKTYGGSSYDFAYTVQQTTDNGYIIGATTSSFGAGDYNAYLLKTDGNGVLQWSKTYGKTGEDRAQCARQTSDGGYILCGRSNSFGAGNFDATLYKTDATGNLLWTKGYGGSGDDQGWYVREIGTNSYVFCGYTVSFGAGIKDALLVKTDANGAPGCNVITATGFTASSVTSVTSTVGTSSTGGVLINPSTAVRNTLSVRTVACAASGSCTINSNFTASSQSTCLNGTINFTNTSTGASTQNWLSNGTIFSSLQNPSLSFPLAGTYEIKLISFNGACTDTSSLTILVSAPSSAALSTTSCQSYTWPLNGQTYTQSGIYTTTILNTAGCDSVVTLNLTINQATNSSETVSNCGSYTWPVTGQNYTQSGTYTSTFTNSAGCLSTQTLYLTINQATNSSETVSNCGSYTWPVTGQTYTQSGTYTSTFTNSSGCLSTQTLYLTINQATNSSETVSNCGSYTWPVTGQTYTQSGTYTSTFTNSAGCLSTQTLYLTINQASSSILTETVLDSYVLNGQTYTQSGTYTQVLLNAAGCDSTITLNLTVNYSGITELLDGIRIYPNPTNENLTLECTPSLQGDYILYDSQGRIVIQGTITEAVTQISLVHLAYGSYNLRLENHNLPLRIVKGSN